jgi:acyl-coenzyme A thioesterase PaaI-like protein
MPLKQFETNPQVAALSHGIFAALDFKDLTIKNASVTATIQAADDYRQTVGSGLASAWLVTALDTLLGMSVFGMIKRTVPIATIDLSTDFMAPMPPGSHAVIRAQCDLVKGNTAFVSGTVHAADTNEPVARTSGKFIVKAKPKKGASQTKSPEALAKAPPQASPYALTDALVNPLFETAKGGHPFANWLGAHQMDTASGPVLHLPFSEMIIGDPMARAVHGGMLASLMEMAAGAAIIQKTGKPDLPAPLSSSINYLKRTTAAACFASAEIERFGRNIIVVHARTWQTDPASPAASATFLFKGPAACD